MLQNCPFHPPGEGWYWRTFTFFTNIFALLREQTSLDSKGAKVSVYCHHQPYTPVYAIFLLYWAWVVRLGVVACTLGWFKLRKLPYSTREKFFKKYFFFWKVVYIKPCIQEIIRIRQLFWPSQNKKKLQGVLNLEHPNLLGVQHKSHHRKKYTRVRPLLMLGHEAMWCSGIAQQS